jgi:hypothetical protein
MANLHQDRMDNLHQDPTVNLHQEDPMGSLHQDPTVNPLRMASRVAYRLDKLDLGSQVHTAKQLTDPVVLHQTHSVPLAHLHRRQHPLLNHMFHRPHQLQTDLPLARQRLRQLPSGRHRPTCSPTLQRI